MGRWEDGKGEGGVTGRQWTEGVPPSRPYSTHTHTGSYTYTRRVRVGAPNVGGRPRARPWSFSVVVVGCWCALRVERRGSVCACRRKGRTHIHTGRSLKSTRRRAALNLQPESLLCSAMNESQQLLQHHPVVVPGMRPY
eukprot:scaffold21268_cov180-Isochrysis_galbana.AAC.1